MFQAFIEKIGEELDLRTGVSTHKLTIRLPNDTTLCLTVTTEDVQKIIASMNTPVAPANGHTNGHTVAHDTNTLDDEDGVNSL